MKKYLYIFKAEFMTKLQYVVDLVIDYILFAMMIFLFMNLWNYIYSDPSELIHGYSMQEMIWYIVVTEVLYMTLKGARLCKEISKDVKSGSIAYKVNKPYSYILFNLSSHLGKIFLDNILYIALSLILGTIFIGNIPINIFEGLIVLISCLLATIISILLITSIALLSFFIEDAQPFYWLYSKFLLIVGVVFPIEYFPNFFQGFLKLSPIYVVCYGPAKLFTHFTTSNMINVLLAQIVYIVISYLICSLVYKKGVKKLNVNGG